MIRVSTYRKGFLKWGPRLLISGLLVSFAGAIGGYSYDLAFLGPLALVISVPLILLGASLTIWGPFMPHWLFEFDEISVRYHKFPNTRIPWSDVRKVFYARGGKGFIEVFIDISDLGYKEKVLRLTDNVTFDPPFLIFDGFILALEKLYGEKVFDATSQMELSSFEWIVINRLFLLMFVAIALGWILDIRFLFPIAIGIIVVTVMLLHVRRRKRNVAKLLN